MKDIDGQLWTLEDVANHLRVAEKTVQRMLQRNEIPAYRVGNQWRFRPSQVQEWLERQSVGAGGIADLLRVDHSAVGVDRLVDSSTVALFDEPPTRREVLSRLASFVAGRFDEIDGDVYLERLLDREHFAETRLGDHLLVPHVRDVSGNPRGSMLLAVAICKRGVAEDPRLTCAVLVCADDLVVHLRLMQKVAYLLRHEKRIEYLIAADSSTEVVRRLMEIERNTPDGI